MGVAFTAPGAGRRRVGVGVGAALLVVAAVAVAVILLTRRAAPAPVAIQGTIAFIHGNDVVVIAGDPARSSPLTTEEISGDESCCTLAWSSDGTHLLIGSDEHLSTVAADGTGHHEIVDEEIVSGVPAWSPDGTRIAVGFEVDGSPRLFVIDADGTGRRNLTPDRQTVGDVGSYAWSPDGRSIVFGAAPGTAGGETAATLDVLSAEGGPIRQVLRADPGLAITEWSSPAWSPDAGSIVYDVSAGSPLDIRLELVSAEAKGAAPKQLSPAGEDAYAAVWSPDGRWVAFTVWRGGTGPADLYVMNADGSGARKLAEDVGANDHPWSPDSASITFGRTGAGSDLDGLWLVNASSGQAARLSEQTVTGGIAWRER